MCCARRQGGCSRYSNSERMNSFVFSSHGAVKLIQADFCWLGWVNTPSTRHAFADLRDTNAAICQHAQAAPVGASCTRVSTKKLTLSLFFSLFFFFFSIVHRPFAPIRGYHRCSAQAEAACAGTKLLLYGKLYLFLPPPRCALREIRG